MKKQLITLLLLMAASFTFAQFDPQNASVNGSFQLDGQWYRPDVAIGITDSALAGRKLGMNGFGNIIYSLGDFKAGMRYEAFLPPLAGFDPRQEGNGFPHIWAGYQREFIDMTVGNFYEQFGSGLLFRSYEEWTLGFDNSMNGIRVLLQPMRGIRLKGIYGSQRFYWQKYERNNRGIVRGLDAEINMNEIIQGWEAAPFRMIVGASGISKYQRAADPVYNLPENVGGMAGRIQLGAGNFSLMTEYAQKINDPSAMNNFIYREGRALLASLSYAERGFGAVIQLKRVDNMSFKSDRSVTANALDINFIPPINRTHAYSLTARYPYATQLNGEMGLQFQLNYKIPRGSKLGGQYGTGIAINFSQVNDIIRNPLNDTIPVGSDGTLGYYSPFFKASKHIFFRDLNVEIDKRFSSKLKAVVQYMNLHYDIATIEGKAGAPPINANLFVTDVTWRFAARKALRFEAQGMFTQQHDGDWAALMIEYTIAPKWFFAIADQFNYGNPDNSKRNHYYTFSAGFTRESSRIALSFGRQAEGVVCVGGVCRQVPASSGLSLSVSTNF